MKRLCSDLVSSAVDSDNTRAFAACASNLATFSVAVLVVFFVDP